MGGDDPLEGLVADRQPPAALAPGDAQLQESANPLRVLRVALLVYRVVNQVACPPLAGALNVMLYRAAWL